MKLEFFKFRKDSKPADVAFLDECSNELEKLKDVGWEAVPDTFHVTEMPDGSGLCEVTLARPNKAKPV